MWEGEVPAIYKLTVLYFRPESLFAGELTHAYWGPGEDKEYLHNQSIAHRGANLKQAWGREIC